jgi:ribosomal protein S12 methylthiotransferase accessory factor
VKIRIEFPGGRRVDAMLRDHRIATDQPAEAGGDDSAAAPFELFFASLATCAGYYALRFCESRDIPTAGLGVELELERPAGRGPISAVHIRVWLPEEFPERYRDALLRAVDQCAVKRFVAEPAPISVDLVATAVPAAGLN